MARQYRRWTAADDAYLCERYSDTSNVKLARTLRRSPMATWHRASALGLTGQQNKWTAREVEILRAEYPYGAIRSLARVLHRSVNSVEAKARDMGLKVTDLRWRGRKGKEHADIPKL